MTPRKQRRSASSSASEAISAIEWFSRCLADRTAKWQEAEKTRQEMLRAIAERIDEFAARINAAYMTLPEKVRNLDIGAAFDGLPPFYKESNRAAVRRIPSSLEAAGLRLLQGPGVLPHDKARMWLDRFLDLAAAEEHRGWCEFHTRQGWRPTQTQDHPRDKEAMRHPALFAWEVLYESNRDKDRRQVRIYLDIVYELGFGVAWD